MRTTKKLKNGVYLGIAETQPINKLGQLEDIEDELGIDLITLFKALNKPIYIKEIDTTMWCSNRLISVLGDHYIIVVGDDLILETKDYGKTWALTKEELE